MKKKIKMLIPLAILSVSMLAGCSEQTENSNKIETEQGFVQKETTTEKQNQDNKDTKKDTAKNTEIITEPDFELEAVKESNIKKIGELVPYQTIDGGELTYKVISAEYSKEFKGKKYGKDEKEWTSYCNIKTDKDGNIQDDKYSWLWITVDIENTGNKDLKWSPEANCIVTAMNTDHTMEQLTEDVVGAYFDGMESTKSSQSYYRALAVNGKKQYMVGYLVKNEMKKKELGYYISAAGADLPDENSFFVKLK